MPALYGSIGPEAVRMLAAEFLTSGGEISDALALARQHVDAVVASYPATEYQDRQRTSLHHALRHLDAPASARFVAELRLLAEDIRRDGLAGDYIARFAVRSDLRGLGTADQLMQAFVVGRPLITLHVRADNDRAIGFYRRHGFVVSSSSRAYLIMQRG
jgi:GNAT superfamily N-acetyltransferase